MTNITNETRIILNQVIAINDVVARERLLINLCDMLMAIIEERESQHLRLLA